MSLVAKKEQQSMLPYRMSNRKIRKKQPPFYNINDDNFYHGPAWVIKPRIFQPNDKLSITPGPCDYHIPDRSIYIRPGKTIGSRYETTPPISTSLLAHYNPNYEYISNAKLPAISITPRRMNYKQKYNHSRQLYLTFKSKSHCQGPLLRPLYGPKVSRKQIQSKLPGPTTYPVFHQDKIRQSRPGFTQKHRFLFDRQLAKLKTNPPFYYPIKNDNYRLPSFTIGKRLFSMTRNDSCVPPYYKPIDKDKLCSNIRKPGTTLKGRWSPLVYNVV